MRRWPNGSPTAARCCSSTTIPARLAGRADERWQVGGDGVVTIAAGPGPVPARRVERVTVRLETLDAGDVLNRVRAMDGVRVLSVAVERADAGVACSGEAEVS